MRIVAGIYRGRRLEEPRGRDVTRPTSDRVREACASALDAALPHGIEGACVLDAFAGSGAFGLEMLSRGASHAAFFDVDRAAAALVRRNVELLGVPPVHASVVNGDVLARAASGRMPGAPYNVVLLDPPYALGCEPAARLLTLLAAGGMLASGAVALFERSSTTEALAVEGFAPLREKRYGKTAVDILTYEDQPCA